MYIRTKRPRAFVIENVPNLLKEFHEVFKNFVVELSEARYKVRYKILDTMAHGGLPQARERLYIVGIAREHVSESRAFKFPRRLKHEPIRITRLFEHKNKKVETSPCDANLNQANIRAALCDAEAQGVCPRREPVMVDIDSSAAFSSKSWHLGHTKTITRARGGTGFYCSMLGRRLCISEMCRLQGFHPETISWQQAGVARTSMGKALGNAMTQSILERLLPRVLWSIGLLAELPNDPWEDEKYFPV